MCVCTCTKTQTHTDTHTWGLQWGSGPCGTWRPAGQCSARTGSGPAGPGVAGGPQTCGWWLSSGSPLWSASVPDQVKGAEVKGEGSGGWGEHTLHLSLDTVETSEPEDLASPQLPLGMVDLLLVVGQLVLRHLIRAVPVPCRLQTLQLVGWHGGNQLGNTAKDEEEGGRRRGVIGKVRCWNKQLSEDSVYVCVEVGRL